MGVLSLSKRRPRWGEQRPEKVDGQRAARTVYYKQRLEKIIKGLFEVTCDDDWDTEYLLNNLLFNGYIVIADSVIGVMPFRCTASGLNYTRFPTRAIVAEPTLKHFTVELGKKGELIFLERTKDDLWFNFRSIVDIYAEKLASADCAIDVNLMNSRMAYMIEAETKAQADTIKEIYDRVSNGDPMVVYKNGTISKDGLSAFFGNVRNSYIAGEIQDTKRTIICEFLTEVGIDNANIDKKERLITSEAESNDVEIAANVSLWKYNLEKCVRRTKKLFPELNFNIELRFDMSKLREEVLADVDNTEGVGGTVGNSNRE